MARIAYHRKYLTEKNSERANQIALRHSREENRMDAKRKSTGNLFIFQPRTVLGGPVTVQVSDIKLSVNPS